MTQQITPYTNYQLSAIGVGVIAVGLADIRQCIDIILKTVPGSAPLMPLFGCDVYKFIDAPVNLAVPNMKRSIFEALDIWEPRIKVTAITHELEYEKIIFSISYQVVDSDLIDTLLWSTDGLEVPIATGLIISALFPAKVSDSSYVVNFSIDGNNAYPVFPETGFDTRYELLGWINENWFNYGKWYLTKNKLILYVSPGVIKKTASLVILQKEYSGDFNSDFNDDF